MIPIVKKCLVGSGYVLGTITYFTLGVIGILIHLWTVLMAFAVKGFLGAFITFVFPVASQFYWIYYSWRLTGTFFNTFCVAVVSYVIIYGLIIIGFAIFSPKED